MALLLAAVMVDATADAGSTVSDPAAALQARFAQLKDRLDRDPFHHQLLLISTEGADRVTGDVYAIVDHPFAVAAAALDRPSEWCDVLILHLNTKYCRPSNDANSAVLRVKIGKKFDQPIKDAYTVDFAWRLVASTANYLQVSLTADDGPLSTRDYRIVLEAAPAENGKTCIRLSYSYSYGTMGRLAMQGYLLTVGRNKVGFTVSGTDSKGDPEYIGGIRGVVERNTMRYHLAIEAYLGALSSPPQERVEKSLRDWYAATEGYRRQLHEMELGEYLAMKRKEYLRQQTQAAL